MIFNMISGGGKFATINLTCTDGATVTCEQTPYSYTETGGTTHTFVVPKAGDWLLTVTKGDMTETRTVTVDTYGGIYEVAISLSFYIFKAGEGAKVSLTPHTERYHTAAGYAPDVRSTANYDSDRIYIRGNTGVVSDTESHDVAGYVDTDSILFTGFNTLRIDSLAYNSFIMRVRRDNTNVLSRTITTTTRGTTSVDISSLTGSYTLRVYADGISHSGTVYNWWLEA